MKILEKKRLKNLKTDFENIIFQEGKYFTIRQIYEQRKESVENYPSVFSYKNNSFVGTRIFSISKTKREIDLQPKPKPSIGLRITAQWYKHKG
jgi:nucleoside-diphosphate-sugar epimerase